MEKICFLIDHIEQLKPESDSSLKLMAESIKRGYETFISHPEDLSYQDDKVVANMRSYPALGSKKIQNLESFKMIFIRQDPPFDLKYITCTYLLDMIKDKVMIINNPSSIRDNPEKLFPLSFPEFIPPTCITSDQDIAKSFIEEVELAVLKPLYAFGGRDIFKVNQQNWLEKFSYLTQKYTDKLILQKFIPEVLKGDKRILMVNGEPLASILRVPESGNILANLAQGGTAHKTTLTEKESKICRTLGKELKRKSIFFAGVDLIDEYLIEINITSPTCIIPANNLYNIKIEELIFDALTK